MSEDKDPNWRERLEQLRSRIDELDVKILDLLNQRARLARETRKRAVRQRGFRRPRWLQVAAAAIFIFIIPALWALKDVQEKNKLELLEKYDKMHYVPYSKQDRQGLYLEKHLAPFSEKHSQQIRDLSVKKREQRAGSYYRNYQRERRSGR